MNVTKNKDHSTTKKNTVAVIAILLVCVLAIGGTIAYLTSHSQLTNKFTVGQINPIDKGDKGPGGTETDPDPVDPGKDNSKLNGNLYEPGWDVDNAKLLPSATIKKDPYVGVGAGSEECDVYVYVKNTMTNNNHIYFSVNAGWEPVAGQATALPNGKYTGGLFKYTAGLNALDAKNNVWTSAPLFTNVEVSNDAKAEDFTVSGNDKTVGAIEVQAFLHQSKNAEKQDIDDNTILEAAKKAFGIK